MDKHSPFHPEAVGRRLKVLREFRKKTRAEFAGAVGIDPTSYGRIEKGLKPLKADMGYMIAERWGVSMDYLYRGRLTELPDSLADSLMRDLSKDQE